MNEYAVRAQESTGTVPHTQDYAVQHVSMCAQVKVGMRLPRSRALQTLMATFIELLADSEHLAISTCIRACHRQPQALKRCQ